MKKLLSPTLLALAAFAVLPAASYAGAFVHFPCLHCCHTCGCGGICLRPYNAFSPVDCGTVDCCGNGCGHGLFRKHHGHCCSAAPACEMSGVCGDACGVAVDLGGGCGAPGGGVYYQGSVPTTAPAAPAQPPAPAEGKVVPSLLKVPSAAPGQ
jgi:hypothetical protein